MSNDAGEWIAPTPDRIASPERPPARGEVHLWRTPIPAAKKYYPHYYSVLSADERARADGFYRAADRTRFVVSRGVVREILGRYLGANAAAVEFSYGRHGKPSLRKSAHGSDVSFNVSHSRDWMVCAITNVDAVGVDIESTESGVDVDNLAGHVFSAAEYAVYAGSPAEIGRRFFFDVWCLKEAYLKATGEGLSFPMNELNATLTETDNPLRMPSSGIGLPPGHWTSRRIGVADGYIGWLVVGGPVDVLASHEWHWLQPGETG